MNSRWTKGLSKEEEALLKESATMGRFALERLIVVMKDYEDLSVQEMTRDKHFEGDWPNKQAALVGEIKVLRKLQDITDSLLTKR